MAIAPASAQEYPANPVRLVVPYPPGGSTDLIARQYAEFLAKEFGKPVIVENRPGAATNIGGEAVAKAKADGYTLLFGGGGLVFNPIFGPVPSYDAMKAFDPVSLIARVPFVIAAGPKAPFASLKEMVAAAKAAPGKRSISSAQLELYVELLKSQAGINLLHVPYKGGAQAMTDTMGGQVDMVFALAPVLLSHIQSGTLKALAVTSAGRSEVLPSVPTLMENGIDYNISIWYGILAPAGTPEKIISRLASITKKIATHEDFMKKLSASGAEPVFNTPGEFQEQLRSESTFWQQIAKRMPHLVSGELKK
jgi:tripartite-type tricarboxylate transporter receptor subunit TctC